MAVNILALKNLHAAPFPRAVDQRIRNAFKPLVTEGLLEIDSTGRAPGAAYFVQFVDGGYEWGKLNRRFAWFFPHVVGMNGLVYVEAIRLRNFCHDVRDGDTCERVCDNTPEQLGKLVADTAIHEAAHLLGVSSGGVDGAGHSGDPKNVMFESRFHKDFMPFTTDSRRTKLYTVVAGDTLSGIADRVGLAPPLGDFRTLYALRGQDGTVNATRLRSGNPDVIFPGERLWIPDVDARLDFIRRVELEERSFTAAQLDEMRRELRGD